MFRRTSVSSVDAIDRSKQIYAPLGGKFNESSKVWRMPNGGRIAFAYLDNVQDAQEYQGRNLTDAWVEEAGQFSTPEAIDRLFGVLRSAAGVPVQLILTANPGGSGQNWIRDRYQLHPFPKSPIIVERKTSSGSSHKIAVIPSRITDNKIMLDNDPQYINRLHLVGSQELVRAWLDGDWSAIEGAFFGEWSEKRHVVEPFAIPSHWMRFRSMDWGSARPFSVGWWAVASDTHHTLCGKTIPRGAMVRYREWYGASAPNVGLKLTAEEVAKGILSKELGDITSNNVLDPACFAQDGGASIAERMANLGVHFRPADNKRVSQKGAMGGWDIMRSRLKGDQDGLPMLFVFSTCQAFIRTIPVLQHDLSRPEDLDTDAEDHVADEARYACMSRPWVSTMPNFSKSNPIDYKSREDSSSWRL